jgi:hypothetical protein
MTVERRPPIGPVLAAIADLLAAWWLGFPNEAIEAELPGNINGQAAADGP